MKKHIGLKILLISSFFASYLIAARPSKAPTAKVSTAKPVATPAQTKEDADDISNRTFSQEDKEQREKRDDVVALVKRGVAFFKEHSIEEIGLAFTHTSEFVFGELYLFVYGMQGRVYAHGQQAELLWKNLYDSRDSFGVYYIREMLEKAKNGGGWVDYEWRGATKVSYVELVTKGDISYMVGCGYHPHIKSDVVVNLVKGAVTMFNQKTAAGSSVSDAMSEFSYPLGKFIVGDLYIYAYDFEGNLYANGDRPGLIGINRINYTDDRGKKLIQEMITKLKETSKGIWIDYIFNGVFKRAYAEKVTGLDGKPYFIACGYYPEINRDDAIDLVRRGYQEIKKVGGDVAFKIISDRQDLTFHKGGLYLVVYDMEGLCLAHGSNVEFVGQNQWNRTDQDGALFVQDMIQKAQADGSGWLNVRLRNALLSTYIEKVDVGLKQYVVATYLYPVNKSETMILLAESGASYLRAHEPKEAFAEFVKGDGKFVRGDLNVFAFDMRGICYAFGDQERLIWRDLSKVQDEDGKFFIHDFIESAKHGAGTVEYKLNKVPKVAHVELVKKGEDEFVVGSSFYQTVVGIR